MEHAQNEATSPCLCMANINQAHTGASSGCTKSWEHCSIEAGAVRSTHPVDVLSTRDDPLDEAIHCHVVRLSQLHAVHHTCRVHTVSCLYLKAEAL